MSTQDSNGHGKVECRTLFLHIRRAQIDDNTLIGRAESVVADRRKDAIPGLPDGGIRKADDDELSVASRGNIDFDIDQVSFDSVNRSTTSFEKHVIVVG